MPTNTFNSYDQVVTSTLTPTTGEATTTSEASFEYQSYRKMSIAGDQNQSIGAVQTNLSYSASIQILPQPGSEQYALGRDGAVYVFADGGIQVIATVRAPGPSSVYWEIAFPTTMALNDTWAVNSYDVPQWYFTHTFTDKTDSLNPVQAATTSYLTPVTVATMADVNATSGSYTGLIKVVYNTTFRPYPYPAGASFIGLNQYTISKTIFWKPGTGIVPEDIRSTYPQIDNNNNNNNAISPINLRAVFVAPTITGVQTDTSTRTLTSSGTPAANG